MEIQQRELHLLDLSPELLHHICSFLAAKQVRVFRLVCRTMADIAACHAFAELTFYLHYGDFEVLRQTANHPEYHKYVKSLVYVTNTLPLRCLSFEKFVAKKYRNDRDRYREDRWIAREDRTRPPLPPKPMSEKVLRENYLLYKAAFDQQASILNMQQDFAILKEVIHKFPNLQRVMISAENEFREGKVAKMPFDPLFVESGDYLLPKGCRHLAAILTALIESPSLSRLRVLQIGSIDWKFLNFLQDATHLTQMVDLCRNLTTFELIIETGYNDDTNQDGVNVVQCRNIVEKGSLRKVLRSMPHLETLAIGFTYPDDENDAYPASFSDLIPPNSHWEHLKKIRLEIVEGGRGEIIEFIRRHSATLSHISLQEVRLLRSSWLVFLPELRQLADDMFLDDVLICGRITGECEEADSPQLDDSEESWDLGDPYVSSPDNLLADDITDYIIFGNCECPLTRENMDI